MIASFQSIKLLISFCLAANCPPGGVARHMEGYTYILMQKSPISSMTPPMSKAMVMTTATATPSGIEEKKKHVLEWAHVVGGSSTCLSNVFGSWT